MRKVVSVNEIWRDVPNFSFYQVSNFGKVYNRELDKPAKVQPLIGKSGNYVTLRQEGRFSTAVVDTLVRELFAPDEIPEKDILPTPLTVRKAPLKGIKRQVRIQETGNVYPSQVACARAIGVSQPMVAKALGSHGRWTANGFHLEYVN